MPYVLPPLKQVPSPNFSNRSQSPINLIVIHDTEGGYAGAINWFSNRLSQVSAHFVLREDGGEATQMVPLSMKAWHACDANSRSIGLEIAGFSAKGFADAEWGSAAAIVAWLLQRYGLPAVWTKGLEGAGFCSHHDLGAAGGGHTDPTAVGSPVWLTFVQAVKDAYAGLGASPPVDWGVHGAVAPRNASFPPAAPATFVPPDHKGKENGDVAGLPPVGSVAWVQQTLNDKFNIQPQLRVDGVMGSETRDAIGAFQVANNISDTDSLDSETMAALAA